MDQGTWGDHPAPLIVDITAADDGTAQYGHGVGDTSQYYDKWDKLAKEEVRKSEAEEEARKWKGIRKRALAAVGAQGARARALSQYDSNVVDLTVNDVGSAGAGGDPDCIITGSADRASKERAASAASADAVATRAGASADRAEAHIVNAALAKEECLLDLHAMLRTRKANIKEGQARRPRPFSFSSKSGQSIQGPKFTGCFFTRLLHLLL